MIMRKFLFSFLILLMLTPSLACAMPSCVKGAKAEMSSSQPCAEHHPGHESGKKETGKVNLLLDCMGVDMQKADTASIDKPDLKKDFVVYALANDAPVIQVLHTDEGTIRGPPPDWPNLHETQPSLILTTQRFRI